MYEQKRLKELVREQRAGFALMHRLDVEERRKATAMIDRAMSQEMSNPTGYIAYFAVAKALADFRANDFAAAIDILKGNPMNKLGPSPQLIRKLVPRFTHGFATANGLCVGRKPPGFSLPASLKPWRNSKPATLLLRLTRYSSPALMTNTFPRWPKLSRIWALMS